jgi:hypothetical protein
VDAHDVHGVVVPSHLAAVAVVELPPLPDHDARLVVNIVEPKRVRDGRRVVPHAPHLRRRGDDDREEEEARASEDGGRREATRGGGGRVAARRGGVETRRPPSRRRTLNFGAVRFEKSASGGCAARVASEALTPTQVPSYTLLDGRSPGTGSSRYV